MSSALAVVLRFSHLLWFGKEAVIYTLRFVNYFRGYIKKISISISFQGNCQEKLGEQLNMGIYCFLEISPTVTYKFN